MKHFEVKKGFDDLIYSGIDFEFPENTITAKLSELTEKHIALWYLDTKNKESILKFFRKKGSDLDITNEYLKPVKLEKVNSDAKK